MKEYIFPIIVIIMQGVLYYLYGTLRSLPAKVAKLERKSVTLVERLRNRKVISYSDFMECLEYKRYTAMDAYDCYCVDITRVNRDLDLLIEYHNLELEIPEVVPEKPPRFVKKKRKTTK